MVVVRGIGGRRDQNAAEQKVAEQIEAPARERVALERSIAAQGDMASQNFELTSTKGGRCGLFAASRYACDSGAIGSAHAAAPWALAAPHTRGGVW